MDIAQGEKRLARGRPVAAAAMVLLALAAGAGCDRRGETAVARHSQPAERIAVVRPRRGEIDHTVTLPGDVVGFYEAALHAKVTGYLKSISTDKGQWVKKGQLLAVLDVPELYSNLEEARARMDIDRVTYERYLRVWSSDHRLVSREQVDIWYSKWKAAEARFRTVQTIVGYTRVYAPFSGMITGRFADPGALIRAGAGDIGVGETSGIISSGATEGSGGHRTGGGPLLTMADVSRVRVYSYIPDDAVAFIRRGTAATVVFDELQGRRYKNQVARIAAALDLATRTMLAEVDLDNPKREIYPRMYAHVTFVLERHPNALLIPVSATAILHKKTLVFVVARGKLQSRYIKPGLSDHRFVEVLRGLTRNDVVVKYYRGDLVDGLAVEPIMKHFGRSWQETARSYAADSKTSD